MVSRDFAHAVELRGLDRVGKRRMRDLHVA
jgi:hypothetical protein